MIVHSHVKGKGGIHVYQSEMKIRANDDLAICGDVKVSNKSCLKSSTYKKNIVLHVNFY